MDWRSIGFNWNQARAFLVVAEEGSLSAAARALGTGQPTIGRQIDALEEELGVVLFERDGRGLVLTPSGSELLDHVRTMAEAAGRMSLTAAGRSRSIEGAVSITATQTTAVFLLPPIVAELRTQHPGIELELVTSNAPLDLRRREADIAIRSFRPKEADLVAKKVRDVDAFLYATPDYLRRFGDPPDIAQAHFIGFERGPAYMQLLKTVGLNLTADNFPLISDDHLVGWELVKRGVAIGVMMSDVGDSEPLVARALPTQEPFRIPMWLTAHRELHKSLRVRTVFDLLASALARESQR